MHALFMLPYTHVYAAKKSFIYKLFHGRTRTAYLYHCVWSGIMVDNSTGALRRDQTNAASVGYTTDR